MENRSFPRWFPWWALVLAAAGVTLCYAALRPVTPGETVYLPGEAVPVEVVPQTFLDRLAALELAESRLTVENGQLRDENGRLGRVNRALQIDTGAVESPEPVEVVRVVREACVTDTVPVGRIRANLFEFEGLDEGGNLAYGWAGNIACDIAAAAEAPDWAVLASEPISLRNTRAVVTAAPAPPRRPQRWYAGLHYSLLDLNDPLPDYPTIDPTMVRAYGGRRWFPARRWTVRTGLFAQSDAVGVDLGLDW